MRKSGLLIVVSVLVMTAALVLLRGVMQHSGGEAAKVGHGLPWQIEPVEGSIKVFNLTLGQSTLTDAMTVFGDDHQLAIMLKPDQAASLEMYFPSLRLGALSGKLIIVADMNAGEVEQFLQQAKKADRLETGAKKVSLIAEQKSKAMTHAIKAMTFVPTARLDENIVLQHFGPAAQIMELSETVKAYLYPRTGVHIIVNSKGKDFIEYSHPKAFSDVPQVLLKRLTTLDEQANN